MRPLTRAATDATTPIRDRVTGVITYERVFGGSALHTLYETRLGRALTYGLLTRPFVNDLYALAQRAPSSRKKIAGFVADLGIDPSEAEKPIEAYRSLDDFFTRRLRPGCRPIDADPESLVSPCDARTIAYRGTERGLRIKGFEVPFDELVGDVETANAFRGGDVIVQRLAPADYHRFHFPVEGRAAAPRRLGRRLHSVHPIALASGAPSFLNQRDVTLIESARLGPLLMIEVGALLVGTIEQTYRPGPVERGAEKGLFRFGGSTVVLVTSPGRVRVDDDLVRSTHEGVETFVRMGARIAGRAATGG